MRLDIVTLFPEAFAPLFCSIPARAQQKGLLEIHLHWLRKWGVGPNYQVDDTPYGGGPGMVLKPEPIFDCFDSLKKESPSPCHVVFPTPQGRPFQQADAFRLSKAQRIVFLCGHYEGVDHRVREALVDEEISLGDYVLSNGELATMVIADAIIRLLPGVIKEESYLCDSFAQGRLDHPHYTKPAEVRGYEVPEVLLSGHHARIEEWRSRESIRRTQELRPDLRTEPWKEKDPSERRGTEDTTAEKGFPNNDE